MKERRPDLRALVRSVPGFPKAGIVFRDVTTLAKDPDGFRAAVDALADRYAALIAYCSRETHPARRPGRDGGACMRRGRAGPKK